MSGALTETARAGAIGHLDGCPDCRELLNTLARDTARDVARETLAATAARLDEIATGATGGSSSGAGFANTALATRDSSPSTVSAGPMTKLGRYTGSRSSAPARWASSIAPTTPSSAARSRSSCSSGPTRR